MKKYKLIVPAWQQILSAIVENKCSIKSIMNYCDLDWVWCYKTLKRLEFLQIVKMKKTGRKFDVSLINKEVAMSCYYLVKHLK